MESSSYEHIVQRIRQDLIDSYDEELELEIDDRRIENLTGAESSADGAPGAGNLERQAYFRELLRLQGELVKLQDWVLHNRRKVVILFEGRDAAGKGGVIKRITQRLNPRICRVAALPAPNDRERTQWYFQRYVSHLPATGPASNGSWASAATKSTRSSSARCPSSRRCWSVRASRW